MPGTCSWVVPRAWERASGACPGRLGRKVYTWRPMGLSNYLGSLKGGYGDI